MSAPTGGQNVMGGPDGRHGHSEHMGQSQACCTVPPCTAVKDYKAQGRFETINGTKTYVTGPADATTGILVVMDIFGFFPQTLQGCDMLATGGTTPHRVFLPDFFDGQPCPIELYPPTPATKDKLSAWFGAHGDAVAGSERLAALLPHVKRFAGEGVAKWAALGYCWGGRVVALASGGAGTPLVCSAQCHPAALKAEDAARIAIPHLVIISQDESKQDFEKFKAAATGCKRLDTHVFDKMIHGGMAARCDFDDPVALKCYEEGYKIAVGFFDKELK